MVDEAAFEELRTGFRGELIRPDDPAYEAARRVWNGMIDVRPALVARPSGTADVQAAVDFAREHALPLAVRGGGHSVAGKSTCEGGVVIDLSSMRGVHVDPAKRTATAQGGALLGDLDRETQVFGLAAPAGLISHTGIGGLTLGGGVGWLGRKHGLACDNLVSAEIVTASGEVVGASEDENPELLWGLRGGGGNFGVVTSFEYRLHPLGPVLGGAVFHRFEAARKLLEFARDFATTAPDEATVFVVVGRAPPAPFLPEDLHGELMVVLPICYLGDPEEGEAILAPLRYLGEPVADTVAPMPYPSLQTMLDASFPHGRRNYWKSSFLAEISDEIVDAALEYAPRMSSPFSSFYFEQLGGAIGRVGRSDTAFAHRDAGYDFAILAAWEDPSEDDEHRRWTREFWDATAPHSMNAVYVNNLGEEGEDRVREAYGPEAYERLVALKDRYDPTNLFRQNQNIRPSAGLAAAG